MLDFATNIFLGDKNIRVYSLNLSASQGGECHYCGVRVATSFPLTSPESIAVFLWATHKLQATYLKVSPQVVQRGELHVEGTAVVDSECQENAGLCRVCRNLFIKESCGMLLE